MIAARHEAQVAVTVLRSVVIALRARLTGVTAETVENVHRGRLTVEIAQNVENVQHVRAMTAAIAIHVRVETDPQADRACIAMASGVRNAVNVPSIVVQIVVQIVARIAVEIADRAVVLPGVALAVLRVAGQRKRVGHSVIVLPVNARSPGVNGPSVANA